MLVLWKLETNRHRPMFGVWLRRKGERKW